jgi:hypothetical protein
MAPEDRHIVTLGKNTSVSATLGLFLISFSIILVGGLPTVNAATTITVNSAWCSGPGFSWDAGTLTCTVTGPQTIPAGDNLAIPSATTLTISGAGSVTFSTTFLISFLVGGTETVTNSNLVITLNGVCSANTISSMLGGATLGSGTTIVSGTACTQTSVPEFPLSAFGPLVLVAALLPILVMMRRRFSSPSA